MFSSFLDAKVAARRKKYGGNKKQNYTEGWVEFKDKSIAKQVANSLNTTVIGGKKNSHYHDDMWNIKYLPKFKWHHLTERIGKFLVFEWFVEGNTLYVFFWVRTKLYSNTIDNFLFPIGHVL